MVSNLSCRRYGVTKVFDQGSDIIKAVSSGGNVWLDLGERERLEHKLEMDVINGKREIGLKSVTDGRVDRTKGLAASSQPV